MRTDPPGRAARRRPRSNIVPGFHSGRLRVGHSIVTSFSPLEMIATGKTDLEALVDEAVSINIITRHLGQVGTAGSSAPEGDDGLPAMTDDPSPLLHKVRERHLPGLISFGRDVDPGSLEALARGAASPGLSSQTKNWCLTMARPSDQVTASESSPSSGARFRLSITIRARPIGFRSAASTTRNQSLAHPARDSGSHFGHDLRRFDPGGCAACGPGSSVRFPRSNHTAVIAIRRTTLTITAVQKTARRG